MRVFLYVPAERHVLLLEEVADVPPPGAVLESDGCEYRVTEVRAQSGGRPAIVFLERLRPLVHAQASARARPRRHTAR